MKKPALLVLAAGMGSRYGGLKQIDPVGGSGEILLDYSIYDALRAGFGRIVFVIRHDIEQAFRERISARWEGRADLSYVFQSIDALPAPYKVPAGRVKPWGTGQAILCAAKAVSEPFAAINSDDFYGADGFRRLAEAFSENRDPAKHFMVGFELDRTLSENGTVSRGVCTAAADGTLSEIEERTGIARRNEVISDDSGRTYTGTETVSMNMWGFMPSIFGELEMQFPEFLRTRIGEPKSEFYIPSAVFSAIRAGRASVGVLKSSDSWFGVTYREDKPGVRESIRRLVSEGRYPAKI